MSASLQERRERGLVANVLGGRPTPGSLCCRQVDDQIFGSAIEVMLPIPFCATLTKTIPIAGRPTVTMVVRETCPAVERTGTRRTVIPAMGNRTTSVKRVAASLQRMPETGARHPRASAGHTPAPRADLPPWDFRGVGVSLTRLLHCMVECFTACPDHLHVQLPGQPTAVLLSAWKGKQMRCGALCRRSEQ